MSKIRVRHASFREGVPQLQSRQNIATTAGGGAALVESIEAIGPGLLVVLEDKDVLVPWPMVIGCVLERDAAEEMPKAKVKAV